MDRRVVLHIGAMKTGTSFVQSVLGSNREALAEAGIGFPGGFGVQSRAVKDLLKLPQQPQRNLRRWTRLADEAATGPQTAVVSMEFLSFARREHLRVLLEPYAGWDVRVVLTVRDQFRVLPAQWQTYTRNFGTDDWAGYLRSIEPPKDEQAPRSRAFRTFHRAQDVERILERWSALPEVSAVDVVTVPPSGAPRDELWNRFCAAAGLDAPTVELAGVRDNESLGYASCDFLRRANAHLQDVAPRLYRNGMRPLAREVLAPLRDSEPRPELDRRAATYARERNAAIRDAVQAGGHRLWGSLEDLPVPDRLKGWSGRVPAPPADGVRRAAEAVWDHAAERTGTPAGQRPGDLDDLVADGTRLLRRAEGWGG